MGLMSNNNTPLGFRILYIPEKTSDPNHQDVIYPIIRLALHPLSYAGACLKSWHIKGIFSPCSLLSLGYRKHVLKSIRLHYILSGMGLWSYCLSTGQVCHILRHNIVVTEYVLYIISPSYVIYIFIIILSYICKFSTLAYTLILPS